MISIIVPAYNVEKYLHRCIDSFLQQNNFDLYRDKIEILIVNDGSNDLTEKIAGEYAEKHPFIKLISQENGGLSAARNTGIINSTHPYIWFVDSDDWVDASSFNTIFNELSTGVDILEFDVVYATEMGNGFTYRTDPYYSNLESRLVQSKDFLENEAYIISVTSKIIKKDLFIKNNLYFPLHRFSEDNIVALHLMIFAKTYKKIKKELYYYYQRADSITNTKTKEHTTKYLYDQLLNLKDMDAILKNQQFNKNKIYHMQSFIVSNSLLSLLHTNFTIDEAKKYLQELRNIKKYPVKKYTYYTSFKREIFRIIFNNEVIFIKYLQYKNK